MKKRVMSIWVAALLCVTAGNAYAVVITPGPSGGNPVVAAVNRATQAVKQIPEQTADQLNPSLTALLSSIKDMQQNQTQIWSQFLKMQSDDRFTASDHGQSAYNLIDNAYSPVRQSAHGDLVMRNNPTTFQAWRLLRQMQAGKAVCAGSDGEKTPSCNGRLDAGGYSYQAELELIRQLQYNDSASVEDLAMSMLNKINAAQDNPLVAAIPFVAITNIIASRTQAPDGTPSMMAALGDAVEGALTIPRENALANASALDVARTQVQETALTNYLLYQNMQLQQQQLAMMAAMMAQNASGSK